MFILEMTCSFWRKVKHNTEGKLLLLCSSDNDQFDSDDFLVMDDISFFIFKMSSSHFFGAFIHQMQMPPQKSANATRFAYPSFSKWRKSGRYFCNTSSSLFRHILFWEHYQTLVFISWPIPPLVPSL